MKKLLFALALLAFAVPAEAQYGAGMVCVGPLAPEPVNHVRMSREGCDWAVTITLAEDGWAWADGWITAQEVNVWPVGTGDGSQGILGHYQHEIGAHHHKGTVIMAVASGGVRVGRGNGWIGTGLGLAAFTGTGALGAPFFTPTIPIRAQGSFEAGGLHWGLRPTVDIMIPFDHNRTVFQEWANCALGTVGRGCVLQHEEQEWEAIIALYITVER